MYVVFERFESHPSNTTNTTVSLRTQELRFVLLTDVVECYEKLNSRFALEHRYSWTERKEKSRRKLRNVREMRLTESRC